MQQRRKRTERVFITLIQWSRRSPSFVTALRQAMAASPSSLAVDVEPIDEDSDSDEDAVPQAGRPAKKRKHEESTQAQALSVRQVRSRLATVVDALDAELLRSLGDWDSLVPDVQNGIIKALVWWAQPFKRDPLAHAAVLALSLTSRALHAHTQVNSHVLAFRTLPPMVQLPVAVASGSQVLTLWLMHTLSGTTQLAQLPLDVQTCFIFAVGYFDAADVLDMFLLRRLRVRPDNRAWVETLFCALIWGMLLCPVAFATSRVKAALEQWENQANVQVGRTFFQSTSQPKLALIPEQVQILALEYETLSVSGIDLPINGRFVRGSVNDAGDEVDWWFLMGTRRNLSGRYFWLQSRGFKACYLPSFYSESGSQGFSRDVWKDIYRRTNQSLSKGSVKQLLRNLGDCDDEQHLLDVLPLFLSWPDVVAKGDQSALWGNTEFQWPLSDKMLAMVLTDMPRDWFVDDDYQEDPAPFFKCMGTRCYVNGETEQLDMQALRFAQSVRQSIGTTAAEDQLILRAFCAGVFPEHGYHWQEQDDTDANQEAIARFMLQLNLVAVTQAELLTTVLRRCVGNLWPAMLREFLTVAQLTASLREVLLDTSLQVQTELEEWITRSHGKSYGPSPARIAAVRRRLREVDAVIDETRYVYYEDI